MFLEFFHFAQETQRFVVHTDEKLTVHFVSARNGSASEITSTPRLSLRDRTFVSVFSLRWRTITNEGGNRQICCDLAVVSAHFWRFYL